MIGQTPSIRRLEEDHLPHVGVKAAMFSFTRLAGVDPVLGVEMASTGEVGCIGRDLDEALLLALMASHTKIPKKGVLVSAGGEPQKLLFLKSARVLRRLGLPMYATTGTAKYLEAHGFKVQAVAWPGEGEPDVLDVIRDGVVDLVINIPKNLQTKELTHGARIRQTAVTFQCSLFTNMEKFSAFTHALDRHPQFLAKHKVISLPPFM
jgi:carbamoyl-phosphate synthase large subunit